MKAGTLDDLRRGLRKYANPKRARISLGFFKTRKSEYGAGDRFIGVTVPQTRAVARRHRDLAFTHIVRLLHSPIHEERLLALIILIDQYKRGDRKTRAQIYRLYLANIACVNNWDLVDTSAPAIVGAHLYPKGLPTLQRLAESKNLWERRIAMVATLYFLRMGHGVETRVIAAMLVDDQHDLIHKAAGWMLRELGKLVSRRELKEFLDVYASHMPRTMLRYAIEHFSKQERKRYLTL